MGVEVVADAGRRELSFDGFRFPLPAEIGDASALALAHHGVTAWHLLRTCAHLRQGESVVVHDAAVGVGALAVQLAVSFGAGRVVATAPTQAQRRLAVRLGADVAVDSSAPGLTERLLTGGLVDVVVGLTPSPSPSPSPNRNPSRNLLPPGPPPPGAMPPGPLPPGPLSTGAVPPGVLPPGPLPPGVLPPGPLPPGALPTGVEQTGVEQTGVEPHGPLTPGTVPPGALPPGPLSTGAVPPGALTPGAVPPGALPPGALPPGALPPGALPPGALPTCAERAARFPAHPGPVDGALALLAPFGRLVCHGEPVDVDPVRLGSRAVVGFRFADCLAKPEMVVAALSELTGLTSAGRLHPLAPARTTR